MEILIANGVDVDQEDPRFGTSLYVACVNQRTDCIKKLLELGTLLCVFKKGDEFYLADWMSSFWHGVSVQSGSFHIATRDISLNPEQSLVLCMSSLKDQNRKV